MSSIGPRRKGLSYILHSGGGAYISASNETESVKNKQVWARCKSHAWKDERENACFAPVTTLRFVRDFDSPSHMSAPEKTKYTASMHKTPNLVRSCHCMYRISYDDRDSRPYVPNPLLDP